MQRNKENLFAKLFALWDGAGECLNLNWQSQRMRNWFINHAMWKLCYCNPMNCESWRGKMRWRLSLCYVDGLSAIHAGITFSVICSVSCLSISRYRKLHAIVVEPTSINAHAISKLVENFVELTNTSIRTLNWKFILFLSILHLLQLENEKLFEHLGSRKSIQWWPGSWRTSKRKHSFQPVEWSSRRWQ